MPEAKLRDTNNDSFTSLPNGPITELYLPGFNNIKPRVLMPRLVHESLHEGNFFFAFFQETGCERKQIMPAAFILGCIYAISSI